MKSFEDDWRLLEGDTDCANNLGIVAFQSDGHALIKCKKVMYWNAIAGVSNGKYSGTDSEACCHCKSREEKEKRKGKRKWENRTR